MFGWAQLWAREFLKLPLAKAFYIFLAVGQYYVYLKYQMDRSCDTCPPFGQKQVEDLNGYLVELSTELLEANFHARGHLHLGKESKTSPANHAITPCVLNSRNWR